MLDLRTVALDAALTHLVPSGEHVPASTITTWSSIADSTVEAIIEAQIATLRKAGEGMLDDLLVTASPGERPAASSDAPTGAALRSGFYTEAGGKRRLVVNGRPARFDAGRWFDLDTGAEITDLPTVGE